MAKAEHMRGDKNPKGKLTEADVLAIRRSPLSQRELARRYGVSQPAISHIRNRATWAWLADDDPPPA